MAGKVRGRRDFLKKAGLALAGAAAVGPRLFSQELTASDLSGQAGAPRVPEIAPGGRLLRASAEPAKVSLVKGGDRRTIVYQSLKAIEDDILGSIGGKRVLVKPNVCVDKNPLAVTHVDSVRAVLDFLSPHVEGTIFVGESGVFNTAEGFKNNGYPALEKEYNARLVDLNLEPWRFRYVLGPEIKPVPVRVIERFLDPGLYVISLARMKTHDCVLVTLALKNLLMAAPVQDYRKSDKGLMHAQDQGLHQRLHFNLFHLAQDVWPDLAVIDGFEAMEGDGPAWGTPFAARVALASLDALAADFTGTRIMGFDPWKIPYLASMAEAEMGQADPQKIRVVGTSLDECLFKFKPNRRLADLYKL